MKSCYSIPRLLLLGALLITVAPEAHAQQRLAVQPESQLWIEGSSTLDTFTCRSGAVEGTGILEARSHGAAPAAGALAPQARVHVRVETFDCGNRRMNRDLYQALRAALHPQIRFELRQAEVLALSEKTEDAYRLRLVGWLTVAGTTRLVETTAHGQRLGEGRYRVGGSQPLRMSDFGIEPPSGLLGLVRAHDRIRVRFDLVAAASLRPSVTPHSTQ